jgi:hypothetical protein
MIDRPLEDLLAMAEQDLKKNQAAFAEVAKKIDAKKPAMQVLADLEKRSPAGRQAARHHQANSDALARFMTDKHIITIPSAAPARVKETPPFMRATTSASMDIPGPFERARARRTTT